MSTKDKIKINLEIKSFPDLPTLIFFPRRQETGIYFVLALTTNGWMTNNSALEPFGSVALKRKEIII